MTHAERMADIKRIHSNLAAYGHTQIPKVAQAAKSITYLLSRVEELEAASKAVCDAFAEWESVRTFRNDINSHEWLALVAAVTAMENSDETPTTTD